MIFRWRSERNGINSIEHRKDVWLGTASYQQSETENHQYKETAQHVLWVFRGGREDLWLGGWKTFCSEGNL